MPTEHYNWDDVETNAPLAYNPLYQLQHAKQEIDASLFAVEEGAGGGISNAAAVNVIPKTIDGSGNLDDSRITDSGSVIDIGDDVNHRFRLDASTIKLGDVAASGHGSLIEIDNMGNVFLGDIDIDSFAAIQLDVPNKVVTINSLPAQIVLDSDAQTIIATAPNGYRLASLTSNGFLKTSGGNGLLTVDTNTYLTGNQTITLTGDVTGSGTTTIPTTITAQNSAFWRGKVTDETGTGLWVFNDSPTLITPVLGVASGTSLNLSGNLTVGGNVAGHLIPSATDTYDLGSSTLLWRKGYLSELDAVLFAQNTASVIGGWLIIAKDEGTVEEDVDTSETQIDFGANNIAANDFIVFRSAGAVEYMQATSLVSGNTWNVTRNVDGSGANAWPQGSVWVNFGYNGTGRVELNANSTPRISILTQGTTYNAQTELLRMGDLNGNWGYSSVKYGFAVGKYASGFSSITVDEDGAISIKNGTTERIGLSAAGVMTFKDSAGTAKITLDASAGMTLDGKLQMLGASSAIAIGTTPPTSASVGTGLWLDRTGLYGLASSVQQAIFDATTGKITAGSGSVALDAAGLTITSGTGVSNKVKWKNASDTVAEIYSIDNAGVNAAEWDAYLRSSYTTGLALAKIQVFNDNSSSSVDFSLIVNGSANNAGASYALLNGTSGKFGGLLIGAGGTVGAMLDVRGNAIITGTLAAGSTPTTLTNSAGKILSAALNTVAVAQGGTGDTGTGWTEYTPTVGSFSGSFTSVSAVGYYKTLGKTCFLMIRVTITTNGTAAGNVTASLPFAANAHSLSQAGPWILQGREDGLSGKALTAALYPDTSTLAATDYTGAYPGGSGAKIDIVGVYETV